MAHWNYRILAKKIGNYVEFAIYEVHYSDDGTPEGCTVNPIRPDAYNDIEDDPIKSIEWKLNMMKLACNKPILDYDNFPNEYKKESEVD